MLIFIWVSRLSTLACSYKYTFNLFVWLQKKQHHEDILVVIVSKLPISLIIIFILSIFLSKTWYVMVDTQKYTFVSFSSLLLFFSYTLSLIKFRLGSLLNDLLIGFILNEIFTSKCLLVDLCFIFESYDFLSQLYNLLIFLVFFMFGTVFHCFC